MNQKDVHERKEVSHVRREVIEAECRRKVSTEDDEKLVQNRGEVLDERCDKRKEES